MNAHNDDDKRMDEILKEDLNVETLREGVPPTAGPSGSRRYTPMPDSRGITVTHLSSSFAASSVTVADAPSLR